MIAWRNALVMCIRMPVETSQGMYALGKRTTNSTVPNITLLDLRSSDTRFSPRFQNNQQKATSADLRCYNRGNVNMHRKFAYTTVWNQCVFTANYGSMNMWQAYPAWLLVARDRNLEDIVGSVRHGFIPLETYYIECSFLFEIRELENRFFRNYF